MPFFPNIPNVPGVPPLFRDPRSPILAAALMVRDILNAFGLLLPQWGIFQDGSPVIRAETVVDFAYKQDWNLLTYPTEDGDFQTYNKVTTPFDVRVRFASGESGGARIDLIESVEAIADNTELYDVVTPEKVYIDCNISHYDYRRTSTQGVGLITLDVWLTQIRSTSQAAFFDTKSPSAASAKSSGIVQPTELEVGGAIG